jgi:hypothetical protein
VIQFFHVIAGENRAKETRSISLPREQNYVSSWEWIKLSLPLEHLSRQGDPVSPKVIFFDGIFRDVLPSSVGHSHGGRNVIWDKLYIYDIA